MEPVAAKRREALPVGDVTPAQLREVERGLKLMLARKFSAVWITENVQDVLAEAHSEYVEWLQDNQPAKNPVGWLLTCAYRRAVNLLDAQNRKPPPTSLDAVFHLADESTPTPERQALENDRQRRLRKAMSNLPDKECKLLRLVYFEGMSIREAGRKLGWQKSAADRHHTAAMQRMATLLRDRNLLTPASLGIAAWVVSKGEGRRPWIAPLEALSGLTREGAVLGIEAMIVGPHRVAEIWRRIAPFSEPGSATALGGVGRGAGYCVAAAGTIACGLAATGVVGPGLSAIDVERSERARPQAAQRAQQTSATATAAEQPQRQRHPRQSKNRTGSTNTSAGGSAQKRGSRNQFAPQATTQDTVTEFGIERESSENTESAPSHESRSGSASSPAPSPLPSPAPSAPKSAASSEFGL